MQTLPLIALTAALALPSWAQQNAGEHAARHPPAAAAAADMADGEIRRVDKGAGKLTIRHGEIKSLDMPPMTMVFQVRDASMLDKVKPGDKVRFTAQKSDTGFMVTQLQAAN